MRTPLTDRLSIEHPILSAPMGKVAGGDLASAVSEAGGLGLIGAGYGDAEWMRRELAKCADARIGIGFITWALDQNPWLLDLALEYNPVAIMFSFGDCSGYIPKVHAAAALAMCQVQTLAQAREAAAMGADIIVAQGAECGGHGMARRSTLGLVPAVVDAVAPVPVVAAGGIADGRGLAASLMLGAAGVLMGTRFYATPEAIGLQDAKQKMIERGGDDTLRTRVFDIARGYDWPSGYTARTVDNDFTKAWHGREAALEADLPRQQDAYAGAVARGDANTAVVFAGEGLDLVGEIEPAGDIVRRTMREAERSLRGSPE